MLTLEAAVAPLDFARRSSLRLVTRSPGLTRILGKRETRVAALGSLQVLLLFALTLRWPLAMYFIGPVVFGVVHLAADLRYLVLRFELPRGLLWVSIAAAVVFTVVRVCGTAGVVKSTLCSEVDIAIGLAWVGAAFALRFRDARVVPALAVLAVLGVLLWVNAELFECVLTHLHNLVAFVVWLTLFRRRPGWAIVPVALVVGATLFLLSGVSVSWTSHHGGLNAFGEGVTHLAQSFAPNVPRKLAIAVAITFIFLQSVHYAVWTGWIPQDGLRGEGSFTFRMTVRALLADFGPRFLSVIAFAIVFFAIAAAIAMKPAVAWYMSVARVHVWFELAMLATLAGVSRRSERAACDMH
jgi:hypothetical protein